MKKFMEFLSNHSKVINIIVSVGTGVFAAAGCLMNTVSAAKKSEEVTNKRMDAVCAEVHECLGVGSDNV